jgi:hypothetical protein
MDGARPYCRNLHKSSEILCILSRHARTACNPEILPRNAGNLCMSPAARPSIPFRPITGCRPCRRLERGDIHLDGQQDHWDQISHGGDRAPCARVLPALYSRELIEIIFAQPYCRIASLVDAGTGSRNTAAKYLRELAAGRSWDSQRDELYISARFLGLLMNGTNEHTAITPQ